MIKSSAPPKQALHLFPPNKHQQANLALRKPSVSAPLMTGRNKLIAQHLQSVEGTDLRVRHAVSQPSASSLCWWKHAYIMFFVFVRYFISYPC